MGPRDTAPEVPSQRRRDIQGLRGIAILLVVCSHVPGVNALSGGFVGVDVFFVISGFVITAMLLRVTERERHAARTYWQFLVGRGYRLVPALALMVAVMTAVTFILQPIVLNREASLGGLTALTFTSNLYFYRYFDSYWNPEIVLNPFVNTWSLGVEFQIYLLYPLLVIWWLSRRRNSLSLGAVVALASAASALYFGYLCSVNPSLAFYSPLARFWEFGIGALVCLVGGRLVGLSSRMLAVMLGAGLALVGAGTALSAGETRASLLVGIVVIGGALIIAGGGSGLRSPLAAPGLTWIGDRSYSWYLWYWPALAVAGWSQSRLPVDLPLLYREHEGTYDRWVGTGLLPALMAVGLSLLLAAASYRLVERPLHRPTVRVRSARALLTGGLFAGATLSATVLYFLSPSAQALDHPSASGGSASVLGFDMPDPGVPAGEFVAAGQSCTPSTLETGVAVSQCTFLEDGPTVVVVGDSTATRFAAALAYLGQRTGFNLTVFYPCHWNSCDVEVVATITEMAPAALFIVERWAAPATVLTFDDRVFHKTTPACDPGLGPTRTCPAHIEFIRQFRSDLAREIATWSALADEVVLVEPMPAHAENPFYCSASSTRLGAWLQNAGDPLACGGTSMAFQRELNGLVPEVLREQGESHANVRSFSPLPGLCPRTGGSICPWVTGSGEGLYADAMHAHPAAHRFLIPSLAPLVADLLER